MKNTIKEINDDEGNIKSHLLINNLGETIVKIEKAVGEKNLSEVEFIDESGYILCDYTTENDLDSKALLDNRGKLIKKGFLEVIEYISEKQYFVISTSSEVDKEPISSDDEVWGVIDSSGNYIVEPEYRDIDYLPKFDLFRCDGDKLVIPNEFEILGDWDENSFENEQLICYKINGKIGLYTKNELILEALFDEVEDTTIEEVVILKRDKKFSIYNWKSKSSIDFAYDEIDSRAILVNGIEGFISYKNDRFGIINKLGETIVEFYFSQINKDSFVDVIDKKNEKISAFTQFIGRAAYDSRFYLFALKLNGEHTIQTIQNCKYGFMTQAGYESYKFVNDNKHRLFIGMGFDSKIGEISCFIPNEKYYSKLELEFLDININNGYQLCVAKLYNKLGIVDNSENQNVVLPFDFDTIRPLFLKPLGIVGFLTFREDTKLYQVWNTNFDNNFEAKHWEVPKEDRQKPLVSEERKEIALSLFKNLIADNLVTITEVNS